MTHSNIQSLRDLLPPQATRTLSYLNEAVDTVGNSRLTRGKYTVYAITSSAVNGFLYLIPMTAQVFLSKQFVTAILHIDFTEIKSDAFQCFKHAFNSFHFAAALTAFVVLSCFRSGIPQNPHQPSLPPEIPPVNPPSLSIPNETQAPSSHQNPHPDLNVLDPENSTHASTFSLISPAAIEKISNHLESEDISSEGESSAPSSPLLKKQPSIESNASVITRYVNPFPISGDLNGEEKQDALPSSPLTGQHLLLSSSSESIHSNGSQTLSRSHSPEPEKDTTLSLSIISPVPIEEIPNNLESEEIPSEEESSAPSSPPLKKQPSIESNASIIARYVNPFPINGDLDDDEEQEVPTSSSLTGQHPALSSPSESIHEDDVNNIMTFSIGPDSFDPNAFSVSLSKKGNGEISSTLPKPIESPVSMKEQKFYDYFDRLKQFLLSDNIKNTVTYIKRYANPPSSYNSNRLTDVCASLIDLINQDTADKKSQYEEFVQMLRRGKELCTSPQQFVNENFFIHELSYYRFTGMHIYTYCQTLVEKVSNRFEEPLSLGNFWDVLRERNGFVNNLPDEENISSGSRAIQKLKGYLNIGFDPLRTGENIPYVYGTLQKNGRSITILRHGVAASHSDAMGNISRFFTLSSSGQGLEMNADYIAFIEQAHSYNKNILHIVLENTDPKSVGDESARTTARLSLGHHPNFYPLALRLDGEFFNAKPYQKEAPDIQSFQERLLEEIFSPTSGFKIPEKIQLAQGDLNTFKTKVKECIDNVKTTYFPEKPHFIFLEQKQAFILLSYVRITHLLLEDLNISILEAHCKDDIDRGGAFKAALILDHHYRMGTLSSSTLQEVMVNIIAAPLIVKKQSIINGRAVLIQAVLDIMKDLSPQLLNTADSFRVAVE